MINYVAVFIVSLLCISLELFLTRILNLKAWNHVVYIIIPFAILGYGIGANICLVWHDYFLKKWRPRNLIAFCLILISLFSLASASILITFPINVDYVVNILVNLKAVSMLLLAYSILMLPFIMIGFVVVYMFLTNPSASHKLYFFDLLGAGLGAFLFYPLINSLEVFHSLIFLSLIIFGVAVFLLVASTWRIVVSLLLLGGWFLVVTMVPEPAGYTIDRSKGWEWIPGYFKKSHYEQVVSRWHPLGRTDIFRIIHPAAVHKLYYDSIGTFEINLEPLPEFSYISTNFLAGAPIYKFSAEGLKERNSKVVLFSQAMEFPYMVSGKDKVLVIGTGGGRDIFMAKTHGVKEIIGAEINPGIYTEMMPGGKYYEYSGGIYKADNTKIDNLDGRQLVKRQPSNSLDLIILNGVDTFSGLSTGAYAYAESYLYTKDALLDYLRVLKPEGLINFNRWFFSYPREDLRLFAIALEALRTLGAENPGDHIILGAHQRWAMMLIKRTPFTAEERKTVLDYFASHDTFYIYPNGRPFSENFQETGDIYNIYLENFKSKRESFFLNHYPFDVSVITDDNPFFYKYYKITAFNPLHVFSERHTGTIIFMTQILVLVQAIIFILIFIFLPLLFFKKGGIKILPAELRNWFILFFSCLGTGFMFIEIPLMQRFVLLLGSPIYALSVTLTILLIATGFGSLLLPQMQKLSRDRQDALSIVGFLALLLIVGLAMSGTQSLDPFIGWSLAGRIFIVGLILFPLGICLGAFFPAGLELIGKDYQTAIPWAWGINSGFSVLGSILAIIFAQFLGFHTILLMAGIIYLIAIMSYRQMVKGLVP